MAIAVLLAGGALIPAAATSGPSARLIDGAVHAAFGLAFGPLAVRRLRRDGDVSGGSQAIAALWLASSLGAGAYAGGTIVDVMDWSDRVESGLPSAVTLASGAAGAWLTLATAGFRAAAAAGGSHSPPFALSLEAKRAARHALDALDLGHATLAGLASRSPSEPLSSGEARASFVPIDDYARLCAELSGTPVAEPLLDAGLSLIDALRLTIVERGWHAAIDIADPQEYVRAVATRYGLPDADPAGAADAVRRAASDRRARALSVVLAA